VWIAVALVITDLLLNFSQNSAIVEEAPGAKRAENGKDLSSPLASMLNAWQKWLLTQLINVNY